MPVSLPDYTVFKGLLICFENEVIDFPSQFTTEDIETISKQKAVTIKELGRASAQAIVAKDA
jgi:hypothetical protein